MRNRIGCISNFIIYDADGTRIIKNTNIPDPNNLPEALLYVHDAAGNIIQE